MFDIKIILFKRIQNLIYLRYSTFKIQSCKTQLFVFVKHVMSIKMLRLNLWGWILGLSIKYPDLMQIADPRINLIPLRYPMGVIPCRDYFNWGIKHFPSNLQVPTLDIEIKRFSPISRYLFMELKHLISISNLGNRILLFDTIMKMIMW